MRENLLAALDKLKGVLRESEGDVVRAKYAPKPKPCPKCGKAPCECAEDPLEMGEEKPMGESKGTTMAVLADNVDPEVLKEILASLDAKKEVL